MAEEEVVPVVSSPVASDHKRKLEDLEPEAPKPTESKPEQLADSKAEPDADKKPDDVEVEDGTSPDTKRPRLDDNKPDGLASENGFDKEKSEVNIKEEAEQPGVKNEEAEHPGVKNEEAEQPGVKNDAEQPGVKVEEAEGASLPQTECVTGTVVKDEEPTGDDHGTVDDHQRSVESSKLDDDGDEKKEETGNLSQDGEEPEYDDTQTTSRKMDVPNDKVGVLIGKGGDTIRYLQYNSGAKIQITRDADADLHSTTRPVEIIGTLSSISKAEKLISAVIAEADAGGSPSLVARGLPSAQPAGVGEQLEMQVPNEKVGLIIGRGGDTIKALQAKSGARIQLIPQHLPEGDGSKERTVRVTGDRKQIEMAREMIKEVMNQNVRPSPYPGSYNQQQTYRPRGPPGPSHWGPRGPHSSQQSSYDYHHRGPYPSQNSQYPPPSYGGYPPHQMGPRGNYGSGWEQRHPPTMPGPGAHGGGYDYYGSHASDHPASGHGHGPGPSPTPAMSQPPSQPNYNYGQSHGMDYGHQASYSQGVPQPSYGHGYDEPKYDSHAHTQHPYGHGSSQSAYPQSGSQPGYGAQPQYGKQPSYGMPSQGPPQSYGPPRPSQPVDMPYQGHIPSSQSYGSNVPPQQQYPYASSGPMQQSFTSAADGYNQTMPASASGYPQQVSQPASSYGQPGGQPATGYAQGSFGGYGSYPSSQQGYPEQPAPNTASYGYQGSQDPAYGSGPGSAYSAPASGQQAYAQPTPTQPSYDQSGAQSGAYAAAPGSAPVGYGKTVSPQPTYPQYDSTQMYVAPR